MRGTALLRFCLLVLLGLLAAAPAGAVFTSPQLAPVKVKPVRGGRHSRFVVSFRTPGEIGRSGILERSETLSVSGPTRQGCRFAEFLSLPATPSGDEVHVTLSAGAGGWCAGRFKGAIVATERVVCGGSGPPHACPEFAIAPEMIARFGFTVATRLR